ncbi:MAG: antibiotic biosynthesis monooxygenase [Rhodobacteraceae bacterium]|nr:antibiotic biosynthesis monooxygenase [Paracoccaceae bacterium]
MSVTIVAEMIARTGKEGDLRAALKELVKPTRAVPGCDSYILHEDRSRPGHFMFYESWRSRKVWELQQSVSPHLAVFQSKAHDLVQVVAVYEMDPIQVD